MIVSVVACGQTAKDWHLTAHDYSIGLNDAFKFGHTFNALCIFNHRSKFSRERQDIILKTRPVKLYTNCLSWVDFFPDHLKCKTRSWDGILRNDITRLMSTNTGPFICMSLAYCLGATKIILWGVEFVNHWLMNPANPETRMELRQYRQLVEALKKVGVETYLGAKGSLLEEFLPIYG